MRQERRRNPRAGVPKTSNEEERYNEEGFVENDTEFEEANFASDPEITPEEQYRPERSATPTDPSEEEEEWENVEDRRGYKEKEPPRRGNERTSRSRSH